MDIRTKAGELVSINPADGSEVARVAVTTPQELDAIVARAQKAYRETGWKELMPHKRAEVLHAIANGLLAEKETLASLQMRDNGKPI